MKASELIERLQEMIERKDDAEVVYGTENYHINDLYFDNRKQIIILKY